MIGCNTGGSGLGSGGGGGVGSRGGGVNERSVRRMIISSFRRSRDRERGGGGEADEDEDEEGDGDGLRRLITNSSCSRAIRSLSLGGGKLCSRGRMTIFSRSIDRSRDLSSRL